MYVEKYLVDGIPLAGEEVSFMLSFGNQHHEGSWWWGMRGDAVLEDVLPEGMSFVSAYLHKCEEVEWCAFNPNISGQTLTWTMWPIGRNQWNEIKLTVLIDSGVEDGSILTNQASISSSHAQKDADPFPDNNASEFMITVKNEGFFIFLPLVSR